MVFVSPARVSVCEVLDAAAVPTAPGNDTPEAEAVEAPVTTAEVPDSSDVSGVSEVTELIPVPATPARETPAGVLVAVAGSVVLVDESESNNELICSVVSAAVDVVAARD